MWHCNAFRPLDVPLRMWAIILHAKYMIFQWALSHEKEPRSIVKVIMQDYRLLHGVIAFVRIHSHANDGPLQP